MARRMLGKNHEMLVAKKSKQLPLPLLIYCSNNLGGIAYVHQLTSDDLGGIAYVIGKTKLQFDPHRRQSTYKDGTFQAGADN